MRVQGKALAAHIKYTASKALAAITCSQKMPQPGSGL